MTDMGHHTLSLPCPPTSSTVSFLAFFGVGHSSEGSISHVLLDSNVVENAVTLNIVCVCVCTTVFSKLASRNGVCLLLTL